MKCLKIHKKTTLLFIAILTCWSVLVASDLVVESVDSVGEETVVMFRLETRKPGAVYTANARVSSLWQNGKCFAKNGFSVLPTNRFFKNDYRFLPLDSDIDRTRSITLKINGKFELDRLKWMSQAEVDQIVAQQYEKYLPRLIFSSATLAILLFLALFSFGRFFQAKEEVYLFYAFYLLASFLLLLRMLEFSPRINVLFSHFPNALIHGKTFMSYAPPMFYAFFQQRFLNIHKDHPEINKRIYQFFYFMIFALVLHYGALALGMKWLWTHYFGLLGIIFIGGYLMVKVFVKIRTRLAAYMLVGTFMLIIGGLVSIWEDAGGIDENAIYWGGRRLFLQIGVLIEILCFSLGLGYKSQQHQEEKLVAQQKLMQQMQVNHNLEIKLQEMLEVKKELQEQYDHLAAASKHDPDLIQVNHELLQRTNKLLTEYLDEVNFGVEQLAEKLGISRVQLHRKLKTLTEFTPTEYIRRFKLQEAMQLLQTTDQTIAEIAYQVGFRDPAYFTKVFNKNFGMNPSDVRQSKAQ